MSLLFLVHDGETGNLFNRGPADAQSSSVDSDFPLFSCMDGDPGTVFRFNEAAEDDFVSKDVCLIADTTDVVDGPAWSEWIVSGGLQVATARPGEPLRLVGELGSTEGLGNIYIYNRQSGNWLHGDGSWGEAQQPALSENDAQFHILDFNVEDRVACREYPTVDLEVSVSPIDSIYVRTVELLPAVNFAHGFGHNLRPADVDIMFSDDGATWQVYDGLTMNVVLKDEFYGFAEVDYQPFHRYWKIVFLGENIEPIYLGQLAIGYAEKAPEALLGQQEDTDVWPQAAMTNMTGASYRTALSGGHGRAFQLSLSRVGRSQSALEKIRWDMWRRSKAGALPISFVPSHTKPEVIFGRAAQGLGVSHPLPYQQLVKLTVEGFPPPIVGL